MGKRAAAGDGDGHGDVLVRYGEREKLKFKSCTCRYGTRGCQQCQQIEVRVNKRVHL